tara:strand:+ start:64 stop:612 length:549 start_codon:yes stop_codon:yes gene_type:complete
MTEMVTGTPAIVGFTNGNDYNRRNGWEYGDYAYARAVDAGEQTRDLLAAIAATDVAVEKTGAANALATEKIGAAGILESAKNSAALHVQMAAMATAAAQQAAANQQASMMYANSNASAAVLLATQNAAAIAAQVAECCCETKELIRANDAQRIRDELSLLQTQFLIVTGGLTPSVARSRIAA